MKIVDDLPDGTRIFQFDAKLPQSANMYGLAAIDKYFVYAADTRRLYSPRISYGWMECWHLERDYKAEEEAELTSDSWKEDLQLEQEK